MVESVAQRVCLAEFRVQAAAEHRALAWRGRMAEARSESAALQALPSLRAAAEHRAWVCLVRAKHPLEVLWRPAEFAPVCLVE